MDGFNSACVRMVRQLSTLLSPRTKGGNLTEPNLKWMMLYADGAISPEERRHGGEQFTCVDHGVS
jgi:hypothetical protein